MKDLLHLEVELVRRSVDVSEWHVEDVVGFERAELEELGDPIVAEDVDGRRKVVLDLNDGAEGDELGPADHVDLRHHPVVVPGFVAPEVEGEESLVGLRHLDSK